MTNNMISPQIRQSTTNQTHDDSKSKASKYFDFAEQTINSQTRDFQFKIMQSTSMLNYSSKGNIGGSENFTVPEAANSFKSFSKEMSLDSLSISKDDKKQLELLLSTAQNSLRRGNADQANSLLGKMEHLISNYEGLQTFSEFKKEQGITEQNTNTSNMDKIHKLFKKMNQYTVNDDISKAQVTRDSLFSKLGKKADYPAFENFTEKYELDELFDPNDQETTKFFSELRTLFDKAQSKESKYGILAARKDWDKLQSKLDSFMKYKPFDSISKSLNLKVLDLSDENLTTLEKQYNEVRKFEGLGRHEQAQSKWQDFIDTVDTYMA